MATSNRLETFGEPMPLVRTASKWFIVTAVAFIALGTIAILAPFVAGLAITALVGWLLVVGGIMHLVSAFRSEGIGRILWQIIVGLFYIVAGSYFLANPLIALGTLTLFLAGVLFVEAGAAIVTWYGTRREQGSGWLLVNAAVTALLAAMIWMQWPSISIWAIGTLVGINLLINGFSRLMLGAAAREAGRVTGYL